MQVNWAPDGEPRYVYGFCNIGTPPNLPGFADFDPHRSNTAHPGVVGSPARYSTAKMRWLRDEDPCDVLDRLGVLEQFYVRPVGFVAFAIGNIDDDGDLDVWSIDNEKHLTHVLAD